MMSTACAKKIWDTLYNAFFKCQSEHIIQVSLIGDVNDVSNTIYGEEKHQTQWAWCSGGKSKGGVIYLSFSILPSLLIIRPLVVLRSPDGVKTECAPTDFGSIFEFVWLQISLSFCLSFSSVFICHLPWWCSLYQMTSKPNPPSSSSGPGARTSTVIIFCSKKQTTNKRLPCTSPSAKFGWDSEAEWHKSDYFR